MNKVMEEAPLVSVICTTYNHEKFIAQAIESFLMQKTSFPIEVIIHDDCSTDGTASIIRSYENRFPELIRPIYQIENQYSLGKRIIGIVLPCCKGKYVAWCEGDDYWTDPLKLQKQVEYLESYTEISLCFHNMNIIYENCDIETHYSNVNQKEITTIDDLAKGNYIYTASTVFRNLFKELPKWFDSSPLGDWPLFLLLAQKGNIGFINDVMGVYRVHNGGVWSSKNRVKMIENLLKVSYFCLKHFSPDLKESFYVTIKKKYWELINLHRNENYLKALLFSLKLLPLLKKGDDIKPKDILWILANPYYTPIKQFLLKSIKLF
jgi:glycosyltransferase involved in cell wall biosynthesis